MIIMTVEHVGVYAPAVGGIKHRLHAVPPAEGPATCQMYNGNLKLGRTN